MQRDRGLSFGNPVTGKESLGCYTTLVVGDPLG